MPHAVIRMAAKDNFKGNFIDTVLAAVEYIKVTAVDPLGLSLRDAGHPVPPRHGAYLHKSRYGPWSPQRLAGLKTTTAGPMSRRRRANWMRLAAEHTADPFN